MLVRPPQYSDESAPGYALRLAARNGLERATWIGNVDVSPHERLRCCPHCLAGARPYWRNAWLNDPPICHQHAVWLVDECSRCHRALTLNAIHHERCRCGAILSESPTSPVSELALSSLKVTAPEMLTWLGAFALYGLKEKPLKKREDRSVRRYSELLEAGATMANEWPVSFEVLLELWQRRTGSSPSLLNVVFPGLMRRIRSAPDPSWKARLLATLSAYAERSRQGDRPILGRNTPRITTVAELAKRLNMRTEGVAAAIDDMAPEGAMLLRSGRRRRVITAALEDRLRANVKARRSLSHAAAYLGFSTERLRLVGEEGLLTASPFGLSQEDIDTFETNLIKHASCAQLSKGDRCLAHVLRTVVTRVETGPFLRAVMAGDFPLRTKSEQGSIAQRLYMRIKDVQAWRQSQQVSVGIDFLSKDEARRVLKLKWEVLCHLIRHGHLRTTERRVGRRCSEVVLLKELERFRAIFIPLSTLAKRSGICAKQAPSWAQSAGIHLITGPTIDGCRQYIARVPQSDATLLSRDLN